MVKEMKPFICLTYHRISSDVDALADPFTVTPEMFKRHMEQLVTWGYRGVSVSQALKNNPHYRLRENLGTAPRVYYLPAVAEKMEA